MRKRQVFHCPRAEYNSINRCSPTLHCMRTTLTLVLPKTIRSIIKSGFSCIARRGILLLHNRRACAIWKLAVCWRGYLPRVHGHRAVVDMLDRSSGNRVCALPIWKILYWAVRSVHYVPGWFIRGGRDCGHKWSAGPGSMLGSRLQTWSAHTIWRMFG